MDKVSNLTSGFEQYFNDLRKAVEESKKETRNYNKQSSYQYKPTEARFKLVVWFKDGNRRTYYSYDGMHHNGERHIDENESLKKLLRLVHKYNGTYKNAIVYANMDPDRIINNNLFNVVVFWFKMNGGNEANNATRFVVQGKNNVVNLKALEIYTPKNFRHG